MTLLRSFLVFLSLLMAGTISGVAPAVADSSALILPVDPEPLVAVGPDGEERRFSIEIAERAEDQAAGLMFRLSMADDHGMLFVFPNTQHRSFWMKNTALPLDIIFIREDGIVADVLPGQPFSLSHIDPGVPVRFVFEVKRGIAGKNGIAPGTLMRHPAIDMISGAK